MSTLFIFKQDRPVRPSNYVCAEPLTSILSSGLFQSIVFHVSRHPQYPEFQQCVSILSLPSGTNEVAYNLFCILAVYLVPLVIITFAYSCILQEILVKTKENKGIS